MLVWTSVSYCRGHMDFLGEGLKPLALLTRNNRVTAPAVTGSGFQCSARRSLL